MGLKMKKIKKDLMFIIPMLLVVIALFMLRLTHMPVHIVLSIVGAVILIAYTVIMKKEWKLPPVEILMRVMYGIALITGVVIMNVHGILVVSIIHKVSAVLFAVLLIAVLVHKFIKK